MARNGHLLFVCTANICRSPMAEALARHAIAAEPDPLRSLRVLSAGVEAQPGQPASENSVVALKKVNLDLSGHRSRVLTQEMLDQALAVYCMTETHRAIIGMQFDRPPANLFLMREFIPDTDHTEIPDPYGMQIRHYEACRDSMVEAIPPLVKHLRGLVQAEGSR